MNADTIDRTQAKQALMQLDRAAVAPTGFNSILIRQVWEGAHRILSTVWDVYAPEGLGCIHRDSFADTFFFPEKEALVAATALFFHDRIEKI